MKKVIVGHSLPVSTRWFTTKQPALDYSKSKGVWDLQSKESIRAEFNRTQVANSTIMYSEAYTEYDEIDIYEAYEAASFDEDTMGAECELLALVEFGALPFDYSEGY